MGREPKTVNLGSIDSQGEDSIFLVKSLNIDYFLLYLISKQLFQNSVDRMLKRGNASMMVGASSWKDQFLEAFTVQAGKFMIPILFD